MTDDIEEPFVRPENSAAHFAQGRPADHDFAILYQGEYETLWDGTAVAVRAHARSLAASGLPLFLKSFSSLVIDERGHATPVHQGGLPGPVRAEVGHLTSVTAKNFFPRILHLVVRDAEHLKRVVMPRGAIAQGGMEEEMELRSKIFGSTIVYSVWERDRIDPAIARTLSKVAECWVPSHQNKAMLVRSGVPEERVVVVPHPYDPSDPITQLRRRQPDTTWRRFYSIGRWEPRKGYSELVEAFLKAFTPTDQATLTIKYTGCQWPNYPTPGATLVRCLADGQIIQNGWTEERIKERITLSEGRFPRPAILKLHYKNNIYVSSSRGEAWCLPAFEAALAGNRILTSNTSVLDFMSSDDSWFGDRHPDEPVPASYSWESDAKWLGFRVDSLRDALRGMTAPGTFEGHDMTQFSMEAVGQIMRERVLKIAGPHPLVTQSGGIR